MAGTMRRFLLQLWCVCGLLLVALAARAQGYAPPAIAGHVTDAAGKLSAPDVARLNAKLADYRRCSSNHIAVFIARSLEGHTVDDVAYTAFNRWKVGEAGKDNGALLVIAPAERKVRIETGKGVGGSLTDLQASDILRQRVSPRLAANDFFGAVDGGTTGIELALGGCETHVAPDPAAAPTGAATSEPRAPASPPAAAPTPAPEPATPTLWFVGLAVLGLLLLVGARPAPFEALVFFIIGAVFCTLAHSFFGTNALIAETALLITGNLFAWYRRLQGPRPADAFGVPDFRAPSNDSSSSYSSSNYSSSFDSSSSSSSSSSSESSYSGGGGSSGGGGASDSY